MAFTVKVTGLKQAAQDLGQLPGVLRASAEKAVNEAVEVVRSEAIKRAAQRVNLSEETLSSFVLARRASVRADGVSGSVQLQIKAVPLQEFGAQVKLEKFKGPDSLNRVYRNRFLPAVRVAIYRGKRAKRLPGGFTSGLRGNGPLGSGERVYKRAGRGYGERSDGTVGTKLTGFRFYTFPKRITDKLLPELQAVAGKQLNVSLRVAYRKQFRGLKVLRLND